MNGEVRSQSVQLTDPGFKELDVLWPHVDPSSRLEKFQDFGPDRSAMFEEFIQLQCNNQCMRKSQPLAMCSATVSGVESSRWKEMASGLVGEERKCISHRCIKTRNVGRRKSLGMNVVDHAPRAIWVALEFPDDPPGSRTLVFEKAMF